ncbi:MAG TPA: hypothetical protein VFI99_15375 [Nocardioides sp.]|nr:hypothetical protein [Nocardioides sp.]
MKLPSISVRSGVAATLSVLAAATALAAMAPSQALDSTAVGPRDSTRAGFPAYYTDDNGVALQLCVDGTAKCGNATMKSDGAGGPGPGVGPDGEGFYFVATTSLSAPGLNLDIEFAAEAAWMSARQPMTFDRVRIRGHSASAGDIPVTTPYGTFTVTADDPVAVRNINFTEDIGCAIAPCDFRRMTTNPLAHITNWITAVNRPAGYLGNAVTEQPATVGVGGPAATASAGGASTSSWVIQGKLAAANRVLLPATLNFGNAARVSTRSVTMKNLGTGPRNITRVTLKGSRNFTIMKSSTCKAGLSLGVGKACKVNVKFTPVRASAATLTITDNIRANTVRLRGR